VAEQLSAVRTAVESPAAHPPRGQERIRVEDASG